MSSQNKAAAVSLAGHFEWPLALCPNCLLGWRSALSHEEIRSTVRFLTQHMSLSPASLSPARRDARTASAESPLPGGATLKSSPGRM